MLNIKYMVLKVPKYADPTKKKGPKHLRWQFGALRASLKNSPKSSRYA